MKKDVHPLESSLLPPVDFASVIYQAIGDVVSSAQLLFHLLQVASNMFERVFEHATLRLVVLPEGLGSAPVLCRVAVPTSRT